MSQKLHLQQGTVRILRVAKGVVEALDSDITVGSLLFRREYHSVRTSSNAFQTLELPEFSGTVASSCLGTVWHFFFLGGVTALPTVCLLGFALLLL